MHLNVHVHILYNIHVHVYICQVYVLYPQEALSIIEPMLSDPVPFVQQV